MTLRPRLTATALGFLGFLLAACAWGQHHASLKVDYEPTPRGGDPNTPANCEGVVAKISISGSSQSFSPAVVTIDPGQPACWTWSGTSAEHSLQADDNSFTSGPPASEGTFQKTFNTPGVYGFYCQVHGSLTSGMRGTVVVRDATATGPGTLQVTTAYTVSENAGTLDVTVLRVGGSDGAAAVKYKTVSGTAKAGKDFLAKTNTLRWLAGDPDPKSFAIPIKNDSVIEPDEIFTIQLSNATGATLSGARSTITIDDDDGPQCEAALLPPKHLRAAGGSAGEIHLTWAAQSAAATSVRVERRLPGGEFEKIGAAASGAGVLVDSGLAGSTVYEYRARTESGTGVSEYSEPFAGATDGMATACAVGGQVLCLNGGRFEATVLWRLSAAEKRREGRGTLLESGNAGVFALAGGDELPLLLSVLDSCGINDRYWVSLAALVDVEFTVKIRDTQTGRTWVHYHPEGEAALPVRDLEAFAVCP